ncbi:MAG: phosphatase PAP2 family protein, partial [bacterium]
MIEWLYTIDVAIFHFLNSTLANPIGDQFWPYLTDYDKKWPVRILLIAIWLALLIRGGKQGRTAAILFIPLLVISDQLSSTVIKSLVARVRPCHAIPAAELHLLVG